MTPEKLSMVIRTTADGDQKTWHTALDESGLTQFLLLQKSLDICHGKSPKCFSQSLTYIKYLARRVEGGSSPSLQPSPYLI